MQSLWMLLASLFFALMAACTKWGAADYGTFTLVFYRSAIGCIAIAAWIIATRREIRTHYLWGHFKRCFIGIGNLALLFWTLSKLPLETGMTLNYTSPLFMALFVVAVSYKKKLPVAWSLIAAIAVGFVGILMVLRPTVSAGQEHIALIGLACGILSTWAYLQVRDLNKLHEPVWRIVFYFTFFGSLFGLLGSFFEPGGISVVPSFRGIAALAGTGLFGLFAQLCLTRAFGAGNLLLTSVLQFSAIAFSAVISAVFFGESIPPVAILGIAVIIAAGSAATLLTKSHMKAIDHK